MTRKMLNAALMLVLAALVANPSQAADDAQAMEEKTRDEAISKTVAWRPKSSESILNKNLKYEETQPWLTAEALLMATFGIGQDEDTVNKALAILDKQAKKNPKDPVSEFYRGEVLYWTKKPDKAKAAWKNANDRAAARIKEDPKDGCAQFYLGASFNRLVKPEEARKALKKAQKSGFDQPMVDFQIGLSYFLEKELEIRQGQLRRGPRDGPEIRAPFLFPSTRLGETRPKGQLPRRSRTVCQAGAEFTGSQDGHGSPFGEEVGMRSKHSRAVGRGRRLVNASS